MAKFVYAKSLDHALLGLSYFYSAKNAKSLSAAKKLIAKGIKAMTQASSSPDAISGIRTLEACLAATGPNPKVIRAKKLKAEDLDVELDAQDEEDEEDVGIEVDEVEEPAEVESEAEIEEVDDINEAVEASLRTIRAKAKASRAIRARRNLRASARK
jgi:hypothetical protein|nr:MAG TPA: hypothetical protein [Caudoviricetes sp.]